MLLLEITGNKKLHGKQSILRDAGHKLIVTIIMIESLILLKMYNGWKSDSAYKLNYITYNHNSNTTLSGTALSGGSGYEMYYTVNSSNHTGGTTCHLKGNWDDFFNIQNNF